MCGQLSASKSQSNLMNMSKPVDVGETAYMKTFQVGWKQS